MQSTLEKRKMIRIDYGFTTKGPLHTGSDVNSGTLKTLRRQVCILREPKTVESYLDADDRLASTAQLVLSAWKSIDFSEIKGKRMMGIWDEFYNKLVAAGRAETKYKFFENLCRSWGIRSLSPNTHALDALKLLSDDDLLETVRDEAQIVCLMVRAIKDAEKMDNQLSLFDSAPVQASEIQPVKREKIRENIPCISGNSIRGKLRRLAMYDFCKLSGIAKMDKRTYHTFFAGGFLDSGTGKEDLEKMEKYVENNPVLGLFGAAIGNMTIEGELKVGWAYPKCVERGTGDKSYWEYIDTVFQTRRDSSKNEAAIEVIESEDDAKRESAQQMKYEYEVFADGTPFEHSFACVSGDSLTISAFWRTMKLFKAAPYLGGMSSVGNGEVVLGLEIDGDDDEYVEYVSKNAEKMRDAWK
jgi:hypothetical protein